MKLFHFYEKSYRNKESLNGVHAIYINNLMRTLAFSIGGLFSPLYIFFLGYDGGGLIEGFRVLIVAIVVERMAVTLLALPLGRLVYKLGFKWSILLGSVILSTYFLLPSIYPRSLTLIIMMSVLAAFEIPIYWLARMSLMSLDGERSRYGHEVSFMAITNRVVSILGPFVGGYLVTIGGFQSLFAVVTVVSTVSALPMFFIDNHKINDGISFSGLVSFIKEKKNRHLNVSFFGQGVNNAIDGFFWPVFSFLILKSYELMGGISSVITALTIVVVYLAGRKFDRLRALGGNEDEVGFSRATIFLSVLTFIRPLFGTVAGIIGHDLIYSFVVPYWWIPYDGYLYSAGKRQVSPLAFFTYREVVYSIGRFAIVAFLYFLLPMIGSGLVWWVVFGIGSIGTWLTLGMKKES